MKRLDNLVIQQNESFIRIFHENKFRDDQYESTIHIYFQMQKDEINEVLTAASFSMRM